MIPRHTIATRRLTLELAHTPRLEDLSLMVKWLNDPEVVKYSEQRHKIHTLKSQLEYIESFIWPDQFWAIYWGDEPIGTITAYVDTNNSVADMGIMIGDTQVWGEDFGTEAWVGLMDHLFNLKIRKIEAGCMDLNRAMVGIFKKSGMTQEGIRQKHFLLDGTPVGMELWMRFSNG